MICYVTGTPGSGKTLWTISTVLQMLKVEPDRPVYTYNVPGIDPNLGWHTLTDLSTVHALPQRSIVVIDEAWQPYPQRKAGTPTPPGVEPFATHRHRGHDFFLMTQRIASTDHFLRGLVGRHIHLERVFGFDYAKSFEWQRLGDPKNPKDEREALVGRFNYPKDVYKLYKSADVHTVKKRIPKKPLLIAGLCITVVIAGAVFAVSRISNPSQPKGEASKTAAPAVPATPRSPKQIADLYMERWAERVPGLPYSAPAYDQLAKPAVIPKISGCALIETPKVSRCTCNTQQGTILRTITAGQCRQYIRDGGWFDFTKTVDESTRHDDMVGGRGGDTGGGAPAPG
ncbi:zonular occludens toxin domain-containing protein [Hydrocarboniphaga effusa]|uniref:zonular occludens toxin domain-containing protein n=1 Tax=Hydrocarboniphaga effusa TaxID=243629 RepID=UPI00398BC6B1